MQVNHDDIVLHNCDNDRNSYIALFPKSGKSRHHCTGYNHQFCTDVLDAVMYGGSKMKKQYFMETSWGGYDCYAAQKDHDDDSHSGSGSNDSDSGSDSSSDEHHRRRRHKRSGDSSDDSSDSDEHHHRRRHKRSGDSSDDSSDSGEHHRRRKHKKHHGHKKQKRSHGKPMYVAIGFR